MAAHTLREALYRVDFEPFFGYYSGVRSLIGQILGGVAGIAIAAHFIKEVQYDNQFSTLLLVGSVLGVLNYLIKPLLELITFPLRLLTLNLFSIVIMMALVWIADIIVARPQFEISGVGGIFWTAMIVWLMSILFEAGLSKTNFIK
jgi:putative membrane protein